MGLITKIIAVKSHISFRQISDILGEHDTYASAYASFLLSSNVPSLQDDLRMLEQQLLSDSDPEDIEVRTIVQIMLYSFILFISYSRKLAIKLQVNHH